MTALAATATSNGKSPKPYRAGGRPPGPPEDPAALSLPDRVAAGLKGLATAAECADLAEGAGHPELAADTVRQFMAHQLAAGHSLAMGMTAQARRRLRDGAASDDDEKGGRRSLELLRFVAGTARMMERCRAAAIALNRIGYPALPEGPDDDGPHRCDHPHHYAWRLAGEREKERRCVLDWLAQGKKPSELPGVDDWPPYHNPDTPDVRKLDERLAAAPHHAEPGLKRGRLKNGNPVGDYMKAPRCGARTRSSGCCRQPAMANGRCRFHGGKSTGARTAEGLQRSRTARLTHGFRTAEIIDLRSAAARVGRNLKALTVIARGRLTTEAQRHRGNEDSDLAFRAMAPLAGSARPLAAPSKQYRPRTAGGPRRLDTSVSLCLCGEPSLSAGSPAGHGVHRSDSSAPLDPRSSPLPPSWARRQL